ncbi:serine carboxypeptidase [Ceraceosorus bombacis]|uniref:Carboxypeptidase n=1 Tax=Ceraceosorus bombacis TaxID=401625 RepID=A0A0P1BH17_9BASI|nr:serine carboxypeptidase [Ceraceosorus bombacis]
MHTLSLLLAALVASAAAAQVPFTQYADVSSPAALGVSVDAQEAFADPNQGFQFTSQGPLRVELPFATSSRTDKGAPMTVEQLIAQQGSKHTVLTHSEFPEISVRIKRISAGKNSGQTFGANESFCDPSVTSWSGYIDTITGKSLFFYFFESRSEPSKDPLILWTNGGPGCSSAIGLFQELGPCRVKDSGGTGARIDGPPINGTEVNPYGWNAKANVIFIDQPVGVGYSYARFGDLVYDSDQGAKDLYKFLRLFLSAFDRFVDNDFIMTGESYGGRYIPRYAAEIADRNFALETKAARHHKKLSRGELINLKRVAIGNGLTDDVAQTLSYYDFTCTAKGGNELYLDIRTCKEMKFWRQRCEKWLPHACRDSHDVALCQNAFDTCLEKLGGPYQRTLRNPYNVNDGCEVGLEPNLCYPIVGDITAYLNREDVRELLGVAPEAGKYTSCNEKVHEGFGKSGDWLVDNTLYISGLLERGYKVLIYVGTLDWICNWLGNKAWVMNMPWTHAEEFHKAKNYQWLVDGHESGEVQQGGNLTWATVLGAGHMVPYDRPKESLQLLHRWLNNERI